MMKQFRYLLICIYVFLLTGNDLLCEEYLMRARIHPESWYQNNWCQDHNGSTEVYLSDNTRADCLTIHHIIEFDFADKWYESLGQSLHYALNFNEWRKPGIVLIIEDPAIDEKFWDRLNTLLDAYHICVDTWAYGNISTERFRERACPVKGDINDDFRIGIEEAIYALQKIGGQ
jgi:hypothetical protein